MFANNVRKTPGIMASPVTCQLLGRGVHVIVSMGAHGPSERLNAAEARDLGAQLLELAKVAEKNAGDRTAFFPGFEKPQFSRV